MRYRQVYSRQRQRKNKHRDESLFSSLCLFLRCHCHCIQTNLNAHMFQKLIINSKRACLLYYIHLNMSTIHKPHSPHESLRDDFYPDRKIYLLFQNIIWLPLRICINVTEIDAKGKWQGNSKNAITQICSNFRLPLQYLRNGTECDWLIKWWYIQCLTSVCVEKTK